jgi:hypothetical protein
LFISFPELEEQAPCLIVGSVVLGHARKGIEEIRSDDHGIVRRLHDLVKKLSVWLRMFV